MKIAIVHDWITLYGGAERVLEEMLRCYPQADLFSLVDFLEPDNRGFIQNKPVTTSFIQHLPFAREKYRSYLPLMPLAIEQLDLSSYDIVISSSFCVAKGVLTGPDQLHLCMCFSPMRYAWDLQHQYLKESKLDRGLKGWLAKWMLHRIRIWDVRTSNGVDEFAAISHFISRRIRKVYGRTSQVIYPHVNTAEFSPNEAKEDFYLTASRFVPYKRVDLIVEAFAGMPEKRLLVIGDGPDVAKVKAAARGAANIELLGYLPTPVMREYMQKARAFVFVAEEDFGITPLEAQACGTPVIAFGKGAARETIRGLDAEIPTGVFFLTQSVSAVQGAVVLFEEHSSRITAAACRRNAERFSPDRFRQAFSNFVDSAWEKAGLHKSEFHRIG